MAFWITIVGLVRRKRVIVPAVLIAAAFAAAAYLGTPVTYVSSTTMVLTTTEYGGTESRDPAKPTDLTNPMLNFNDSLLTTSAILIEAMNTKDVASQVGAVGHTQLVVNDGRTNPNLLGLNGPFLYIVARSTSPEDARRVVLEAQELMRGKLLEWQSALRAPEKTYVALVDVVPPSVPEPDRARATKRGIMAFVFGLGLSLGVAYYGHQIRARRRDRDSSRATSVGARPIDEGALRQPGPHPSPVPADVPVEKQAQPALVPTSQKTLAEPTLVRRSLKKKADLAGATQPTRPPRPRPSRPATPPHIGQPAQVAAPTGPPGPRADRPATSRRAEPALVPVPVKRKDRSRNP